MGTTCHSTACEKSAELSKSQLVLLLIISKAKAQVGCPCHSAGGLNMPNSLNYTVLTMLTMMC